MESNETVLKVDDRNKFIETHMPFIVKSITKVTKRYVSLENDDELSIALIAFNEAIDKYSAERGPFLAFAQLVIISRIKTYLQRETKNSANESLDKLKDEGIEVGSIIETPTEDMCILKTEILTLKSNLIGFGFDFEDLVDESPKHKDTRNNAIYISERVSKDPPLTSFMYEKKRLPIKQISIKYSITEKILKGSKKFIIAVVIIFDKNFRNLKLWIRR